MLPLIRGDADDLIHIHVDSFAIHDACQFYNSLLVSFAPLLEDARAFILSDWSCSELRQRDE